MKALQNCSCTNTYGSSEFHILYSYSVVTCTYLSELFIQGGSFHSAVEDVLTSGATWLDTDPPEPTGYPPEIQGYMESIAHILQDVGAVRAIESTVHHNTLNYRGIVDCVARYR